ncbi:MAG TPA: hypothetical protein P5077_00210 [bacterium]|nr:hypothetical protein [bacterium]
MNRMYRARPSRAQEFFSSYWPIILSIAALFCSSFYVYDKINSNIDDRTSKNVAIYMQGINLSLTSVNSKLETLSEIKEDIKVYKKTIDEQSDRILVLETKVASAKRANGNIAKFRNNVNPKSNYKEMADLTASLSLSSLDN